ncbi:DNA recombination protein RmuC [Candidatus Peregrinibacteria bacterium]|nr:DNA recombination protein RmuC [Candidatus Peregrinibacteria bacterium]
MTLPFLLGLVIGLLVGGIAAYALARRSYADAESVAETLSAKVVAKQTEQILKLAESKLEGKKDVIDGTLKHMKDDLGKVEKLMRAIEQDRAEKFGKIDTRLENAATVIKDLAGTAEGLKNALSNNSGRGQWGERMAEDVLRLSGLVEGINYIKQKKLENSGSKPDFTFALPQGLKLNMDVKFPFNNYQLYVEAKSEKDREEYKKKFLKDVRDRLKEIRTRDYINPENQTVDYVLLFVPNEQIFGFINEMDRELIDEAMRGKTILCSPLSLYAILAVIRQSIDSFSIEEQSQEMLSLFGAFKLQWDKFKEQMDTVKARFETVHKGYEELTGTRERMLDRHLDKIEELRIERGATNANIGTAFSTAAKKLTKSAVSGD